MSLKVLVVDDDPLVRVTTAETLIELGYEVREASSGDEALQYEDSFDLLVTDVAMPEMFGSELARRMRARIPELPVLYVTGFTSAKLKLDTFTRALLKPWRQSQLEHELALLLGGGARRLG